MEARPFESWKLEEEGTNWSRRGDVCVLTHIAPTHRGGAAERYGLTLRIAATTAEARVARSGAGGCDRELVGAPETRPVSKRAGLSSFERKERAGSRDLFSIGARSSSPGNAIPESNRRFSSARARSCTSRAIHANSAVLAVDREKLAWTKRGRTRSLGVETPASVLGQRSNNDIAPARVLHALRQPNVLDQINLGFFFRISSSILR